MRAAVLGHPIAHSLSPVLHRAAYDALGLHDWTYEAIDVDVLGLPAAIGALDARWAGLSLTMPLKQDVIGLLAEVSDLGRRVGAVNTVVPAGAGRWRGENTDVAGIVAAFAEVGLTRARSAAILGGGATAASALVALAALGVQEPRVHVRSPQRAQALIEVASRGGTILHLLPWDDDDQGRAALMTSMLEADVVLSTAPAGAADRLAGLVPPARPPRAVLLDVVYAHRPTPLVRAWTEAGAAALDGSRMLLHQATAQVELMTGRPAPIEAMRRALDLATT